MTEHQDHGPHVTELLPEYVTGRLDAGRDADVRAHLAGCRVCTAEAADLAALTAALREVDPDDLLPAVPAGLDERVAASLAHRAPPPRAGRSWLLPVAAALAGALAAGSVVAAVRDGEDDPVAAPPVSEPVTIVAQADGLDVQAELVDHTWGLEIDLRGTGFADGAEYRVVVVDRDGRRHPSGAFVGVGAVEMDCALSSAVLRADAVAFRVVGRGGRTVVRADLAT